MEDAVFVSSKTYALKFKNSEITKIKGFEQDLFDFNTLKNLFYSNKKEISTLNDYINKKNLQIFKIKNEKTLNLENYDKRKFINNKKHTIPFYCHNYLNYI